MVWDEGAGPAYRQRNGVGKAQAHDGIEPVSDAPVSDPRSGGPPWQVQVGVVLYAVWWVFVSIRLMQQGSYSATAWWGVGVWTIVIGLALYRVWRGGPVARWFLHRFGVGVGAVLGLGIALLAYTLSERLTWDFSTITGPLVAVVLFGAGLLFGTAPARAWCPGSNPGNP